MGVSSHVSWCKHLQLGVWGWTGGCCCNPQLQAPLILPYITITILLYIYIYIYIYIYTILLYILFFKPIIFFSKFNFHWYGSYPYKKISEILPWISCQLVIISVLYRYIYYCAFTVNFCYKCKREYHLIWWNLIKTSFLKLVWYSVN